MATHDHTGPTEKLTVFEDNEREVLGIVAEQIDAVTKIGVAGLASSSNKE
jgi:hypothetical protein